ncbi:hypothetical protein ID858_04525 [Xenorhabdus sp. DI]|uniref:hypothetical protein n=1 Tax=Xenorhabdus doucetiae TaxID=351671 RepID=UPI0019C63C0F|nr:MULTISPECIES: hypothetical protein [unclassified Xenorhabdus]MBD2784106.1 hypothetical protein [Xenorhabdus sp. 3]MBD2787769.1 hypothetical protein [Xenorhabdus sp. DI]
MFRSKSFNINNPSPFGNLPRVKSSPNILETDFDARMLITIKKVSAGEALHLTDIMVINSREWRYDNPLVPPDDEQTKWNKRYDDAHNILCCIDSYIKYIDKKNLLFFVAYFRGVPVGALQFTYKDEPDKNKPADAPKINYLATHCGIRNCGALLVEYAVNESLQLGMDGKLRLAPLDNSSIPVSIKMGFTQLEGGKYLYLNPAESNKWDCSNPNRYRYRGC